MDFLGFKKLMKQRAKNLPEEVHNVIKDVSKTYLLTVADLTPVDTSAAVSNWQIGINAAPSGVVSPHAHGRYGSTALESFNVTMRLGSALIDSSKAGDEIHITNNLHYIGDLDDGTSTQAPTGMTAIADMTARRVIGRAKVVKPR